MTGGPSALSVPRLLVDRQFGPFFLGKVVSSCGIWIQNLAASVLMYELTGSPFMVGMVSVAQFSASTFLPIWSGALTDRVSRSLLIFVGRIVSAAAVLVLAGALLFRGVDGFGGPPMLLATVAVMGAGLGLASPAMQAVVPSLVERRNLEPALALSSSAPSVARAVGPVIGAWLLVISDFGTAFVVAGVTHLIFAGVLLTVTVAPTARPRTRPALLGGVRYAWREPAVGRRIVAIAIVGIGADPVVTLTPAIADALGGAAQTVGYLAAAFGTGSVVLTFALGRLRRRASLSSVGVAGFWVAAVGLLAVSTMAHVALAIVGFFVAGIGYMMGSVAMNTRIQEEVPDELRGRVMALFMIAFLGSRPLGAVLNGGLAELFSVPVALVVLAALMVVASRLVRPDTAHSATRT